MKKLALTYYSTPPENAERVPIIGHSIFDQLPFVDVPVKESTVRVYEIVNLDGKTVQILHNPFHSGMACNYRNPEFVEKLNQINSARCYQGL